MRIVNVVGARPNLMKIAPLISEMRRFPDVKPLLVHTGQHYDENMSRVFLKELGIPQPHHNLGIGSGTHTWQTAQVMLALESLLRELAPDLVLVVGDVNSTLAAALVAARLQLPLAHVEAGLRSFDRSMPEEVNRIVTDTLSDFLFTTEPSANENLRREGVPEKRIHFVGNVMIDTLRAHLVRARALDMAARLGIQPKEYALVTLHRPSNVDCLEVLQRLLQVLTVLQSHIRTVFPIHPRTKGRLAQTGLFDEIRGMSNLHTLEPLGYLEFLGLMADAKMVLTDSGGIQEETTILQVPCLTFRDNTERPVTVTMGTNKLVGTLPERIIPAIHEILNGPAVVGSIPELWDGKAAARIVSVLREQDHE